MKKSIVLFLSVIASIILFSQNYEIGWQSCFGGTDPDQAYDIVQTSDGYFLFGGTNSNDGDISFHHGGQDMWLIKMDNSGGLLWEKCYGGSHSETGDRIFKSIGNNDYFLVGTSSSNDGDISNNPYTDARNLWIVKIDSLGNILWDRIIGNNVGFAYEMNAAPTSDGGLIIAAQIDSQGGDITSYFGGYDGWLIKLDSNGETEWDQAIGSETDFEFINGIIQTTDGGYLAGLLGTPQGAGSGNVECTTQSLFKPDAILFKLDSNGNKEWEQCYGGSDSDGISRLLEIDDGYLIAALSNSNDGDLQGSGWHGGFDIWLVRTDFSGNIIWQKSFGGSRHELPQKIFQTENGGFTVIGITQSNDGDVSGNHSNQEYDNDIWIIKITGEGELLCQQCIGGVADERMYFGAIKKSDNNYVIAGETNFGPSYDVQCTPHGGDGDIDFWVFEISDTNTNIIEQNENDNGLKVYPNPANSILYIELEDGENHYNIFILNLLGVTVLEKEINSVKTNINIAHIPKGVYIMKIVNSQNTMNSINQFIIYR